MKKIILLSIAIFTLSINCLNAQKFHDVGLFQKVANSSYYIIDNKRHTFNQETGQFIPLNETINNLWGNNLYCKGENVVSSRLVQTISNDDFFNDVQLVLPSVNGKYMSFESSHFYPYGSNPRKSGYNGKALFINNAYYFLFEKFEYGESSNNIEDKIGKGVCYWDEDEDKILYLRGTEVLPDLLWTLYGAIEYGKEFKNHLFFKAKWHDNKYRLFFYPPYADKKGLAISDATFISFKDTSLNNEANYIKTLNQTDSLLYFLYSNKDEYFVGTLDAVDRYDSEDSDFYILLADYFNGMKKENKKYIYADEQYLALTSNLNDSLFVLNYMNNNIDTLIIPAEQVAADINYGKILRIDDQCVFFLEKQEFNYASTVYKIDKDGFIAYDFPGYDIEINSTDPPMCDQYNNDYFFKLHKNSYRSSLFKLASDTLVAIEEVSSMYNINAKFNTIGDYTFLGNKYAIGEIGELSKISYSNSCPGVTDTLTLPTNDGISLQWYKNDSVLAGETNDTLIITYADTSEYYFAKATKDSTFVQYSRIYTAKTNTNGKPELYSPLMISNGCINLYDNNPEITIDAAMNGSTYSGNIVQDSMFLAFGDTLIELRYHANYPKYAIKGNKITINNFSPEDIGLYQLQLYGGECVYEAKSDTFKIDSLAYPKLLNNFNDTKGCEGLPFELTTIAKESDGSAVYGIDLKFNTTDTTDFTYLTSTGYNDAPDTLIYKIDTFKVENTGYYFANINGKCYDIITDTIAVNMGYPYTLTAKPADTASCPGTEVALSVAATTEGMLNYQWYKDSVEIADATDSLLTIAELATADTALYTVKLTGDCQSEEFAAKVDILKATEIVELSPDTLVNEGENVTLTVKASGEGSLSYQWLFNSESISDANTESLELTGVTETNDGEYAVEVSATCGAVTSDAIKLSIEVIDDGGETGNYQATNKTIQVFPNPSNSILNISSEQQATLQLINVAGITVFTKTFNGITQIDISNYANGVYIANINTKNGIKTYRIIKN